MLLLSQHSCQEVDVKTQLLLCPSPHAMGRFITHSAKFAICFTASTAPGRGSSSMKKFLDSQMLMAFSCEGKVNNYCTSCNFSCMCILLTLC